MFAKGQTLDLKFAKGFAELVRLGLRRAILESTTGLWRCRIPGSVRHHAVALLVVVSAGAADAAAGGRRVLPAPFGCQIEFGVEIENPPKQVRSADRRRIQQGVRLDSLGVDKQVVPVGLQVTECELAVEPVRPQRLGRFSGPPGVC